MKEQLDKLEKALENLFEEMFGKILVKSLDFLMWLLEERK